ATIMAHDDETFVAEGPHQPGHDRGDVAFGIGVVGRIGLQEPAVAIAGQIGNDEAEFAAEFRRQAVPASMGLRIAMKQQQWRTFAAKPAIKLNPRAHDAALLESGKQIAHGSRLYRSGQSSTSNSGLPPKTGLQPVRSARRRYA